MNAVLLRLVLLGLAVWMTASGSSSAAQTGSKAWVTVLCRFADHPETPHPKSWYETLMLRTNGVSMDDYFRELSYGQLNLSGSIVAGWYDLPGTATDYVDQFGGPDREKLLRDVMNVADADVFFPDFYGINIMLNGPLPFNCYGGIYTATNDNQARLYGATFMQLICHNHASLAHEMGHGFGLDHSSGPYFPDELYGPHTYDSYWDTMSYGGNCNPGDPEYFCTGVHFNAYHKDIAGWILSARKFIADSGTNATIRLERLALPGTNGYLMAQVIMPGWGSRYYTVEARRRAGYDGNGLPAECVLIHKVDVTRIDRQSQVIDGGVLPDGNENPNDAGAQWLPGETFTDTVNGITISVIAQTTTGFDVRIAVAASSLRPNVVTSTADDGPGTLREAIRWANITGGGAVSFNLPGERVIPLLAPLPDIAANGVILDAATQPGARSGAMVEVCGTNVATGFAGLQVLSGHNLLRGLAFTGFPFDGVSLYGSAAVSNRIERCSFGVRLDGVTPLGNRRTGVSISGGAKNNLIGGTNETNRNLISFNGGVGLYLGGPDTTGNRVEGNSIGVDASGLYSLGNGTEGVWINGANGNVIGGEAPDARNFISGNAYRGVLIDNNAASNVVNRNFIGTDADGIAAIGNGFEGVALNGEAHDNLVGGTNDYGGNLISGNLNGGVWIGGAGTTGNRLEGNIIGLAANESTALPNGGEGVTIVMGASGNVIGGRTPFAPNRISGNGRSGIYISDLGTTGNVVEGNLIGPIVGNGGEGIIIRGGARGNRIGGSFVFARNIIAGNARSGIWIGEPGTGANIIQGNVIGANPDDPTVRGNNFDGISLLLGTDGNLIGGTDEFYANIITGNLGRGIWISDVGTTNNIIQGNWIGTDRNGRLGLGNGLEGIILIDGATHNTIGRTLEGHNVIGKALDGSGVGNIIANSGGPGILVFDSDCTGNSLRANQIYNNSGLSIDLRGGMEDFRGVTANDPGDTDAGPNSLQNYPELTAARYGGGVTTVSGTFNSAPNGYYILDFFRVPSDSEMPEYLGAVRVRTDSSGNADFATGLAPLAADDFITATATDLAMGDTSEFSANTRLTNTPPNWPIIVQPPHDTLTSTGAVVTLDVIAQGSPPLRYQWRFNGVSILNATNSSLVLTNIQFSQAGWYSVLVSNALGFAASPEALVKVLRGATLPPIFNPPFTVSGDFFGTGVISGLQSGAIYRLQVSSNLIHWTVHSAFDGDVGTIGFFDPVVAPPVPIGQRYSRRFYRIVSP